jgi:hypothetical protein
MAKSCQASPRSTRTGEAAGPSDLLAFSHSRAVVREWRRYSKSGYPAVAMQERVVLARGAIFEIDWLRSSQ